MPMTRADAESLRDALRMLQHFVTHPVLPVRDTPSWYLHDSLEANIRLLTEKQAEAQRSMEEAEAAWRTVERLTVPADQFPGEDSRVRCHRIRRAAWQLFTYRPTPGSRPPRKAIRYLQKCDGVIRTAPDEPYGAEPTAKPVKAEGNRNAGRNVIDLDETDDGFDEEEAIKRVQADLERYSACDRLMMGDFGAPLPVSPRPRHSGANKDIDETPAGGKPTDAFAALREFARSKLKGKERAVIEALCESNGMRFPDLAIKDGVGWIDPDQGFKDAQKRLNPKLRKQGWRLSSVNKAATLEELKRG